MWKCYCEPIELCLRGFARLCLHRALRLVVNTVDSMRKETQGILTEAADKASRWLGIKRELPLEHKSGTDYPCFRCPGKGVS